MTHCFASERQLFGYGASYDYGVLETLCSGHFMNQVEGSVSNRGKVYIIDTQVSNYFKHCKTVVNKRPMDLRHLPLMELQFKSLSYYVRNSANSSGSSLHLYSHFCIMLEEAE